MRRALALPLALAALLCLAPAANAAFGLTDLQVSSEAQGGGDALGAGTHPFAIITQVAVTTEVDPDSGKTVPSEEAKDLEISFPPGLIGNTTAVPACPTPVFLAGKNGECENDSAVGTAEVEFGEPGKIVTVPVYNLEPTPGAAAKLGFIVEDRAPVTIEVGLNPDSPNNVEAHATNVSQALFFFRAAVTVWGTPADSAHDEDRGSCALDLETCPYEGPGEVPFLTLPTACEPLDFAFEADSWQSPGAWVGGSASAGEIVDCEEVGFDPQISAAPTTSSASSPSGLDFAIDVADPGLLEPDGRALSTIEKAVVTLPAGMTINPGAAEGLAACSEESFDAETLASGPTCPGASKVGEVEVQTPLLAEAQTGSIYVATPYENPFGSLLAIYMVIRNPKLGILVKLPGEISADPTTGQLTTTFGDEPHPIPQVPFSHFEFHFRSGPRAPLTTPPGCGPHTATAVFTPASGNEAAVREATITTTSGPDGSPCPAGELPFSPGFSAGSQSNQAGAFSPFHMRLTRGAGEQEIRDLSTVLPQGLVGKVAGVERCSDAALAAAGSRSGALELSLPSCPQGSKLGTIASGAGAGSALTYVQGSLYLAGPHNNSPLSIAAVVPAVAGPFDLGTVVVRVGLDLDPNTGEARVKGAADSIPRILAGIPLALRDVRISTDRPNFTLNPTDCEPLATRAQITGSPASASLTSPYRASGCAALKFKPRLSLRFSGQMKRTGNPAVTSVLRPRAGDANLAGATVLLPATQFIDNAHINNPCTRVQFNADQCPKGSVLGTARAFTPLLDEPLEGPVYFRSNGGERELPDLVADLHGQFRIVLVGFVDSHKKRVRTRFLGVPDAPVSKFVLKLSGGRKGLLENSVDLCRTRPRAHLALFAQNGRRQIADRAIATSCAKKGKGGKR